MAYIRADHLHAIIGRPANRLFPNQYQLQMRPVPRWKLPPRLIPHKTSPQQKQHPLRIPAVPQARSNVISLILP